jgi:hypothetical protein
LENEDADKPQEFKMPYPPWFIDLRSELKKEGLKAGEILSAEPKIWKRFMDHLSKRVVHDVPVKTLVFLTGISTYTAEPTNLFTRGEPSIGKTYNVVETLRYFPRDDVWNLGGLSRTALAHEHGALLDRNDNPINWEDRPSGRKPQKGKKESPQEFKHRLTVWKREQERWQEKLRNSRYVVDLTGKILVFLEAPDFETYQRLRPILSHDVPEISYRFTDKVGGTLRTQHVVVKGWPATIFLSTAEEFIEDLATRSFTVTPSANEKKIGDAINVKAKRGMFPWHYEFGPEFMLLEGYIHWLKYQLENVRIINPLEGGLAECYPTDLPRRMRDFNHLCSLIKISTGFHCMQRPVLMVAEQPYVLSTPKDLELILNILPEIEETTVSGIPGHILEVFHRVMEPLFQAQGPFEYTELRDKHNDLFHRKRSTSVLRNYVQLLREIGYVDTEPHPSDKRKRLISVIKDVKTLSDSVQDTFSKSFIEKKLKEWFDAVKKSVHENRVFLRHNLTSDAEINIETMFKQYYAMGIIIQKQISVMQKDDFGGHISPMPKQVSLDETSQEIRPFSEQTDMDRNKGFRENLETPSIQDSYQALRSKFKESPFYQQKAIDLIVKSHKCDLKEAERIFQRLVDEGKLFRDPYGLWRFLNE